MKPEQEMRNGYKVLKLFSDKIPEKTIITVCHPLDRKDVRNDLNLSIDKLIAEQAARQ